MWTDLRQKNAPVMVIDDFVHANLKSSSTPHYKELSFLVMNGSAQQRDFYLELKLHDGSHRSDVGVNVYLNRGALIAIRDRINVELGK